MKGKTRRLEDIVGELKCPKNFRCYRSGFKTLCKAKDIGLERHLVCLEKNPKKCVFAFSFGGEYFCTCPVRIYIAKNIKDAREWR